MLTTAELSGVQSFIVLSFLISSMLENVLNNVVECSQVATSQELFTALGPPN